MVQQLVHFIKSYVFIAGQKVIFKIGLFTIMYIRQKIETYLP